MEATDRELAKRAIEDCPVFTCLDAAQISNMVGCCEVEYAETGAVIFRQGPADTTHLFIVADGEVEELDVDGGSTRHVQTLGRGGMVGVDAFMFGSKRSSTVRATTPVKLFRAKSTEFQQRVLDSPHIRSIYDSFSSRVDSKTGERFMDRRDLVRACSSSSDPIAFAKIAAIYSLFINDDGGKYIDSLSTPVSYPEWAVFSIFLTRPDPHFDIAFLLVDADRKGYVTLDDVKRSLRNFRLLPASLPLLEGKPSPLLNFDADVFRRFFGKAGQGRLRMSEFSSFMSELQRETGRQSFGALLQARKRDHLGHLSGEDLSAILLAHVGDHPVSVSNRLLSVLLSSKNKVFTFADFVAYQNALQHLPVVASVIRSALRAKGGGAQAAVSKDDYKQASKLLMDPHYARPEVDAVFSLLDTEGTGFITAEGMQSVLGPDYVKQLKAVEGREGKLTLVPPPGSTYRTAGAGDSGSSTPVLLSSAERVLKSVKEFLEHFVLGAIAGGIGAFAVFPIDLVKTRLQAQRSGKAPLPLPDGSLPPHYKGAIDCFRQTLAKEGIRGFYRGFLPQLLGVGPEKALKLTVNDLLRQAFTNPDKGEIYFPLEILSGAGAGASQVVVTNPLEVVKIRLQMQGETETMLRAAGKVPPPRKTALDIVKELKLAGLYRGTTACLLRDVPFSAIYFPAYAAAKTAIAASSEDGRLRPHHMLIAGALAGIPAAGLVTPADVVKTRLQAAQRSGEQTYSGIADALVKIYAAEGMSGLYRGALMRVARSSPQFGVTLVAYEMLHTAFASSETTPMPPTNAPVAWDDYDSYRRRTTEANAAAATSLLRVFGGVEGRAK